MIMPQVISFLREKVPLFTGFMDCRLDELGNGSHPATFEANGVIAHQGDEALHFGVVLGGTVNVSVIGEGGARQAILRKMGKGSGRSE